MNGKSNNRYYISIKTDYREDEYYAYKYFEAKGIITNCKYDEDNSKLIINFNSLRDVLKAVPNVSIFKVSVPRALRMIEDEDKGVSSPLFSMQMIEKHLISVLRMIRKQEALFRIEKTLSKKLLKGSRFENSIRRKLIEYILSQFADDEVVVVYDSREKIIIYTKTLDGKKRLEQLDIEAYFDNKIFTYKCPACGEMFDQLADLRLHYVRRHNIIECPLDSEPLDSHMCNDFQHCAYAFLTFFYFNDPLLNSTSFELYKIAYLCARYTFNAKEDFYST